jgi:hypothetical protein
MKPSWNRWPSVLGVILCLSLLGCSGDGDSPTDPLPTNDAMLLESITPSPFEPLVAGSRVTFRVRSRYALATANTGHVTLVIEDQNLRLFSPTAQQRATVTRGEGRVEIADTVDIPARGVTLVHVFTPLFPAGSSSSTAVQQATYTVRQP